MSDKEIRVYVIEVVDGEVTNLVSFPNTEEGKGEARELFSKIALENGAKRYELKEWLEDGYYDDAGGYAVNIQTW